MENDEEGCVYEDDLLEEISVEDGDGDILADEIEDATLDEYDADQEDDDSEENDEKCVTEFKQHKGPVFVVDVDRKNGEMAVSGGEDEMAYVWSLESGETLFVCDGHKDSVTCACFNADSSLVATGDMGGIIQAWSINSKNIIWKFETADLEWMLWHPVAAVLLAGTHDGQSWMWQIPKDNCRTFLSHGFSTSSGIFMPDGKSAVTGYEDGTIKVIDLKTADIRFNIKGRDAHRAGVSDVCSSADGNLIATVSLDGTAKLISAVSGKVSATYNCAMKQHNRNVDATEEDEEKESVECVGFSPTLPLLATGCLNGFLYIWDYKTGILRHSCKHEEGITKLSWDPAHHGGTLVYTGCLDGTCRSWDARDGQLLQTFTGHRDHIYDLKITSNGERLLSASADGTVRVFKIREKDTEPLR